MKEKRKKLRQFLKENPKDIWAWVHANGLRENFERTAKRCGLPVVKLNDWTFYSHKITAMLRARMHGSLADHIRQNSSHEIFPFTLVDLAKHLEKHFQPGMGWHNSSKWHIDHVKPKSRFKFKSFSDQSFLDCWSLDNLRPMWAHENLVKHAK